jgi:hypothetical protein
LRSAFALLVAAAALILARGRRARFAAAIAVLLAVLLLFVPAVSSSLFAHAPPDETRERTFADVRLASIALIAVVLLAAAFATPQSRRGRALSVAATLVVTSLWLRWSLQHGPSTRYTTGDGLHVAILRTTAFTLGAVLLWRLAVWHRETAWTFAVAGGAWTVSLALVVQEIWRSAPADAGDLGFRFDAEESLGFVLSLYPASLVPTAVLIQLALLAPMSRLPPRSPVCTTPRGTA